MIQRIVEIVNENFMKVDILNGVGTAQKIFYEKNIDCFPAYEEDKLVGVVTKKELVAAHPNRIIIDVMSDKYKCVDCNTYSWEVRKIFDLDKDIDVVFVEENNEIIGFVTNVTLRIELGKHIDLLTGLYKKEYMVYNAYNLIKSGQDMAMIFIDLNNFGYIDKKYGHINGDKILKSIAEILKANVPLDSYLCRYAGDEFAILTPYCINDSKELAEEIIRSINKFKFPNNIPVSASIGITGCRFNNKKTENIQKLINQLVNVSSLASTKAKKNNCSIIIENMDIA
ncbi:GGDEF domain-containing protein [Clostridium sp. MB40-C1]|uniref:GGDEF domain-containing protein n=1 Tax=Clostridium sp. MB40-C1 TaxID=3070996 RepID=UPI0027E09845|nr:GGDEF domain-containing protein [Clostridium sp. MB40-C1]WMJ80409.1 GGDEF domain-containing protein [Clostridium sp. MB40-C1]